MKLITKEIERKLGKFPLYSQDGKGDEAQIIVKFFDPTGSATWYVTEGTQLEDGDWEFFGFVTGLGFDELGYFRLSQLTAIKCRFGLSVERDRYLTVNTIGEVKEGRH